MNSKTNYEEYKQLLTSALEKQSEEIANQILVILHFSQTGFIEKETKNLFNYLQYKLNYQSHNYAYYKSNDFTF